MWRKKGDKISTAERTATNQAGPNLHLPAPVPPSRPRSRHADGVRRVRAAGWRRCERTAPLESGPRDQRGSARLPHHDVRAGRSGRAPRADRLPQRPRARDLQRSISPAAAAVPGGGRRVAVDPRLGYRPHALRSPGRRVRTAVERGPRAGQAAAAANAGHHWHRIRQDRSVPYPILDHVLRARRAGVGGMKALILYPMNALANDQAKRLADLLTTREELAGITAALYTGRKAPQRTRSARTA